MISGCCEIVEVLSDGLAAESPAPRGFRAFSMHAFHVQISEFYNLQEMRSKICQKTNLTASAGIAPNTFLAKVGLIN